MCSCTNFFLVPAPIFLFFYISFFCLFLTVHLLSCFWFLWKVYLYVQICTYIFACMYTHTCIHICIHIYIDVYIYT